MGVLEICLMVAAGILGFIFGHENGRRNAIQEAMFAQQYEQDRALWEESMKNLSGRYFHEDDEEEDPDDD
jgi:hypothetical protein